MAQTEKEQKVQSKTMQIIRQHGAYVYKNAQSMYTEPGRPDLVSCIPVKISTLIKEFGENATVGLFVGIELKRLGHLSEVSQAQQIVGNKIKACGGLWLAIEDPYIIEALMIRLKGDKNV